MPRQDVVPSAPTPTPAASADLRAGVLAWYRARGRDLAFRGTTDPYAILVSEAMAQQTQAARAADYWTRFLAEFPTVEALAVATPAAVIRAWRGLGYNRRALALRAAAIAIVRDHGGRVPGELDALQRLPGVGPYTARAVAALAFGQRVGAVDVNVRRVLSRAIGGADDAFAPVQLQVVADASVAPDDPGLWTHALMDVGATFCRPRAPRCMECPAAPWCRYAPGAVAPGGAGPQGGAEPRGTAIALADRPTRRLARESPAPYATTNRWLRGRLLDLLRDAPDGAWSAIKSTMGSHDGVAIDAALAALAREGLAERHPADPWRARLPIA